MPADSGLLIGQAIYGWSRSGLSGKTGFGFQSISPILKPRLQWLDKQAGPAKNFPALDEGGNPARGSEGRILPTRYLIGHLAVASFKTFQGADANGRPGSYACQILVAEPATLTLSAVINLDDKELIKPYSSVLAQHHPDLDDMNLDAGVRPSPQGIGAQIGPLLERLNRSGWSAIELSPEQLTLIPMIMGILGKGWDAAATLDAVKVPEGLAWRLSLPAAIEQRPANGPGFASADGDESWTEMRARLARCSTREALRRAWNAEQADEADISIAVDEPAAQQDLSEFENAVSEYVHGNGLRLYATLSELPEDTVGRGFELVLNTLGAKGWRLATRGPSIDDVNRRLLAFAAGKWSSLHELERILPRERVRLTDLAMVRLIPEMLVEVVRRNASAEPHELIALRYPDVSPELWETIALLWQRSADDREGVVKTFRASGTSDQGLLRRLIASDSERMPRDLVFGAIVPRSFSPKEALPIVVALESEFLEWSRLPQFYWATLRPDSAAAKVLRRIREFGRRPGS